MFSVIPAGRACLTSFNAVSATQFTISFPSNPPFSHLVVFLIPGQALPPSTGAGVYFKLPGKADFQFLGAIANEKPSAVFKVNLPTSGPTEGQTGDIDAMTESNSSTAGVTGLQDEIAGEIHLGISVEPAVNIQAQLAMLQPPLPTTSSAIVLHRQPAPTKVLAQRIIKNAFNFLASFAGGQGGQETVPLKSFQDWWTKFERRIENDPGFLDRD